MGMRFNLVLAERDQICSLLASPDQVHEFVYGAAAADDDEHGSRNRLSLDKTWHGLHFLLTGADWGEGSPPLNFILAGGEWIGDVEVGGYGPARALTPEQLAELYRAIDAISPDELRQRFDPAKMMELDLYPPIWDRDPAEDDAFGWLLAFFERLKPFLRKGTQQGLGCIMYFE